MIRLVQDEIEDEFAQENFRRLQDLWNENPVLKAGFKFYSITTTAAVTNQAFKHNLDFTPSDIIVLSRVPYTATFTPRFDTFNATNIYFDTSAAVTVRFFLGRYA